MPIKALLDNLDEVGEAAKGFYKETEDGKFMLDVTPVEGYTLEKVDGLRSALSKERQNVTTLKEQVSGLDGLDLAEAREAMKQVEKMKDWTPEEEVKQKMAAQIQQIETKFNKDLGIKDTAIATLVSQLETTLVDNAVRSALSSHEMVKGGSDLIMPHIKKFIKLTEVDGNKVPQILNENGEPRISQETGATGPMGIPEFITTLKDHEACSLVFKGTGANGPNGKNINNGNNQPNQNRVSGGAEKKPVPQAALSTLLTEARKNQ